MTEEPYRWLEAVENRREYVRSQITAGTPVFAASMAGGLLLAGVGTGQSKVFEIFERHAMAGLGHPADLEKLRQMAIDAAHLEGFARAPEDVAMRRLVGGVLSVQVKSSFEQIYAPPYLAELLLAEIGQDPALDHLMRLHFDGSFETVAGRVAIASSGTGAGEAEWAHWIETKLVGDAEARVVADVLLQAWWCMVQAKCAPGAAPDEAERRGGWREATRDKVVEALWMDRVKPLRSRFVMISRADILKAS